MTDQAPPPFVILSTRELAAGLVDVWASVGVGRYVHVAVPKRHSDAESVAAMIRAAIKTGRYEPAPPRSFEP